MITVTNCDSVVNVGNIPSTVEKLHIEDCKSLATVMCGGQWNMFNSSEATDGDGGDSSGGQLQLAHLVFLDISGCPKFMSLPDYVLLPSIQTMYMWDNDNQGALPKLMHTFTSLNFLSIRRCPKIHKFPEGGLPRTLTDLHIEDVNIKQPIREWGLGHLTHLRDLEIINIGWSGDSVECIMGKDITVGEDDDHDDSGCHFILYLPSTSLDYLKIAGFKILKSINCSTFSNLGALTIKHCPDLESMGPNNSLPSRLQLVEIENCPLIHKHCKPTPDGPIIIDDEWYTIS